MKITSTPVHRRTGVLRACLMHRAGLPHTTRADFLPDSLCRDLPRPALLPLAFAAPSTLDILWQQNHCGIFSSPEIGGANWV